MTTWQIIWVMAGVCWLACVSGWLFAPKDYWRDSFGAAAILMTVWLVVVGSLAVWEV